MSSVNKQLPGEDAAAAVDDEHGGGGKDSLADLNWTLRSQLECSYLNHTWTGPNYPGSHCSPDFDGISCWSPVSAGQLRVIPCFEELNGIRYDTKDNASRLCLVTGEWAVKSNYSQCRVLHVDSSADDLNGPDEHADYRSIIYLCGYSLSLIALFIACSIFFYFKEIHCLRNKIHTNLFITYILSNFCWILSTTIQATETDGATNMVWCATIVLVRYFHLTTFFWMFVEGLYLFVQVIAAFAVDNSCFKLRHYLCLGYGCPFIIVLMWASLMSQLSNGSGRTSVSDLVNQTATSFMTSSINVRGTPMIGAVASAPMDGAGVGAGAGNLPHAVSPPPPPLLPPPPSGGECNFVAVNDLEYIYIVPILFVLGLNTFFLIWIMWVVVTKLRSPHNTAAEHDHQNWKAAKALLVIIPLLGITYLLTIAGPTNKKYVFYTIFQHVRAFLLSIQGFAVTLPYCFLNTEIRNVVRGHWDRYQTNRSMAEQSRIGGMGGQNSTRNSFSLQQHSDVHGPRRSLTLKLNMNGSSPGGHSGGRGSSSSSRPRLFHQQSLPTYSATAESSFGRQEGESKSSSNGGGRGGGAFLPSLRSKKERYMDVHTTIEEASDEFKNSSGGGGNDNENEQPLLGEETSDGKK